MDPETPAIETAGLYRRYGRRWALLDVSLRVRAGAVVMLTGPNGSGKSTLLRVLATALRPDQGSARVCGHDVRLARGSARRRIALLSHQSYLYEALSALENLRIATGFLGGDASRARLLATLEQVGLAARAEDPVATFSAGMRKRLSLARTLLKDASVVLLDEPYGELDPEGFTLVDGVLARLRRRGASVLMATHLLDHGRGLCDEALALQAGRLVWSGAARELPAPEARAGGGASGSAA